MANPPPGSTLTLENLMAAKRMLGTYASPNDRRPHHLEHLMDDASIIGGFMGMKIVSSPYVPPRQQKIKVRDIKFSDGTSILSKEWLDNENDWWAKEFGYATYAYMFGGTAFVDPATAVRLVTPVDTPAIDMPAHRV